MSTMITIVDYPNDWSIIKTEADDYIAVAYKGDPTTFLSFVIPEDSDLRFVDIQDLLIGGTIVTTDYITAFTVEVGEEWDDFGGVYPIRTVYVPLQGEHAGKVFAASADTVDDAVETLQAFTGKVEGEDA